MTSVLPNPFNFGQPEPSRFVLDEVAFMDALDPLPVFLTGPRVDPDRELYRISPPETWPSWSQALRALCEVVDWKDLAGRRP